MCNKLIKLAQDSGLLDKLAGTFDQIAAAGQRIANAANVSAKPRGFQALDGNIGAGASGALPGEKSVRLGKNTNEYGVIPQVPAVVGVLPGGPAAPYAGSPGYLKLHPQG